ncbi:hypothetical protein AMTR_s00149p00067630 [Amborella trichopoda]|uniref:Smr domain-containing protein n=2 Tax=Amborella trichopoda TaxID=13333 RepID=W1PQ08_AMBTC|nr:hypothetical protein AMTR_s00149p00067630 [Amborella trichopoda]
MDTIFYNVMMKSLRNGKQWEVLEELAMEMIEKGIQLDNVSYSTIITCAKRCNFFDKAIEWFERMYRTGLMPDEVTYSAILDVYAKLGKTEEVLSLYDRARADGWEPDAVTFSVLGKMYGEIGDYDGIQYVLQEMRGIGIKPNLIVYNTLLEAMGKAGKPGLARSLFDEMIRSGLQPNVITLTALIKIYGKARWARDAFELWEEIKSNNWPVDFILYNTLLSMCADLGREEEAEKLFDDMKKSELCKPDSWSYTAMLNIYCNGGEVEKAHELFREMLGSGNKLNVMSFTCLIQCYGRAKRFDDVVEVFNIMVERGVRPDDRLCGCLLSVLTFSKNGEFGSVLICLEKANRRLVHFIDILDKEEATLDMVKEKFREILNESVVEVRRPYCNCLIDICCNRGLTKRAHELLYLGNLFGLYSNLNTKTEMEWSLNLRSLSVGAAFTAFEEWLRALIEGIEHNERLPTCFAIHTGVGGRKLSQGLADSLSLHLKKMGSPFQQSEERAGWFVAAREEVVLWVRSLDSKSLLATA